MQMVRISRSMRNDGRIFTIALESKFERTREGVATLLRPESNLMHPGVQRYRGFFSRNPERLAACVGKMSDGGLRMENRGSWMADQDTKGERRKFYRRGAEFTETGVFITQELLLCVLSASTLSLF